MADPQRPWLTLTVTCKRTEAVDVTSFELRDPDGRELPPFTAGAHVDVEVAPGLVRQYSLCSPPAERDRYLIAVLREPASRGGSTAMVDQVREGDHIRIGAPRNHFALEPGATRSLLLAGGIGVTPILCMAERLAHAGQDFAFHYANRSRVRSAFIDRIAAAPFAESVHLHFDDEAGGLIDLEAVIGAPDAGTHLYVCGPAPFIGAVLATAERLGWPAGQLHREYFQAAVPEPVDTDGAFRIRIASSGAEFDVPADRPVIDVLADAGIHVPVSCEQGVCGTCVTGLLAGQPDHRDMFMTDAEHARGDQFTPCCSRAKSPLLVLDL